MNEFNPDLHIMINGGFMAKDAVNSALQIRQISTGAMQRRFSIAEESAVEAGNDVTAKVIRSRLLNADFCDLDFTDTQEGLAYIVNYLASVPNPYVQGEMLVTKPSMRLDELLADGQQGEAV